MKKKGPVWRLHDCTTMLARKVSPKSRPVRQLRSREEKKGSASCRFGSFGVRCGAVAGPLPGALSNERARACSKQLHYGHHRSVVVWWQWQGKESKQSLLEMRVFIHYNQSPLLKKNEEEKKSRPPFHPFVRVCRPAALPSADAGLPPTRGSHDSHVYSLGSLEFHPSHVHTIEP
jgi:hypothetical protein